MLDHAHQAIRLQHGPHAGQGLAEGAPGAFEARDRAHVRRVQDGQVTRGEVRVVRRHEHAVADEHGVDAPSMRKLAERLGVGAMSLYTYVENKDDMIEGMVDLVKKEKADVGIAFDGDGDRVLSELFV